MIESRCGIICSECDYREEMNCPTCAVMDTPFWGENCPVKDCCESKNYQHCGECSEFPCKLLNSFAYHEEQGDDGLRIEQCRAWARINMD